MFGQTLPGHRGACDHCGMTNKIVAAGVAGADFLAGLHERRSAIARRAALRARVHGTRPADPDAALSDDSMAADFLIESGADVVAAQAAADAQRTHPATTMEIISERQQQPLQQTDETVGLSAAERAELRRRVFGTRAAGVVFNRDME